VRLECGTGTTESNEPASVSSDGRSLQINYLEHLQEGCVWQTSLTATPGAQVAVSPGWQVIAQDAQRPTAGTLHDAPSGAFCFVSVDFFFFSEAKPGFAAIKPAMRATSKSFIMVRPPSVECLTQ
jgi:hypothetical protein